MRASNDVDIKQSPNPCKRTVMITTLLQTLVPSCRVPFRARKTGRLFLLYPPRESWRPRWPTRLLSLSSCTVAAAKHRRDVAFNAPPYHCLDDSPFSSNTSFNAMPLCGEPQLALPVLRLTELGRPADNEGDKGKEGETSYVC